jgi:hypothetical protein
MMKTSSKAIGLVLLASLLTATAWGQTPPAAADKKVAAQSPSPALNIHSTDDPDVIRETQLGVNANHYVGLVWWIPFEFWMDAGVKRGTPPEKTRETLKALQEYTVVGAFLAKVSDLGSFDYLTPADLQKKTFLRDADGQEYAAITEVSGDAKNLADLMKPMLANAMGRAGENFAMMFFPAKSKTGKVIADATTKGKFTVLLKDAAGEPETLFLWQTPLSSFMTPRYCPVGKERVHANWEYCPWHGVKLEDKP